jgi:holo-[acyl-carrier protein] synthase
MIAIGTDIVEIDRIRAVWTRHPRRFAARILTAAELERCARSREPWRFLAKRFAAKEAVAKCFGTGIGVALSWHDLEVGQLESGAPQVHLGQRAQRLAAQRGGSRVLLSLADERAYAVAFAALVS